MTAAVPAELAATDVFLMAGENPATLDISDPCPTEVCTAVQCIWLIVRDLAAKVEAIEARQGGRF